MLEKEPASVRKAHSGTYARAGHGRRHLPSPAPMQFGGRVAGSDCRVERRVYGGITRVERKQEDSLKGISCDWTRLAMA